jgi:hypothetical protein
MRNPMDKIWYMSDNKPVQGIIYLVESYIGTEKNSDREKADAPHGYYLKLTDKIVHRYYIVNDHQLIHTSPSDLKNIAISYKEERVFGTRKELVESLLED